MTRKRGGLGYQVRLKPKELVLLLWGLEALRDANRQNPALLGLFRRQAANLILSLQWRLLKAAAPHLEGKGRRGPNPRVRLNATNLYVCLKALEQIPAALERRPDLFSVVVNPQRVSDAAERLKLRLEAWLARYPEPEEAESPSSPPGEPEKRETTRQ